MGGDHHRRAEAVELDEQPDQPFAGPANAPLNLHCEISAARRWWSFDYGTALRDQVAIALLLKESGLPGDRLARLLDAMPGANLLPDSLSTQEQAWAAAAAYTRAKSRRPSWLSYQ